MNHEATYSPEDNKLRLYPACRLDAEEYARVKAAGFAWAPKQELFVSPMWTPQREDLLLEMCGEIGDEGMSLEERQAARAERFEGYSSRRLQDAERTAAAVSELANGIPLGQPILVGHHSEKRARKDAERIQNGTRKAVNLWKTSEYWSDRAEGAIRHAKYKELPEVRNRRIRKIEADRRKKEREIAQAKAVSAIWSKLHEPDSLKRKDGQPANLTFQERAEWAANNMRGVRFGLWSDLRDGKITPEDAQRSVVEGCARIVEWADRWIEHFDNRLTFERAMLAESGWKAPEKKKSAKASLPLLNIRGPVEVRNKYHGTVATYPVHEMTKAEYAKLHADYKGTDISACGLFRVRGAMIRSSLVTVFLTDSKEHERPSQEETEDGRREAEEAIERRKREKAMQRLEAAERGREAAAAKESATAERFKALEQVAKAAVQVVSVPQLFPTPLELAARMAAELGTSRQGRTLTLLEPSAGTGRLLRAALEAGGVVTTAIELDGKLCDRLRVDGFDDVRQEDFLRCGDELGRFDRVIMNPPFERAQDVAHIRHAWQFVKPGGRLVALCAAGPRQREGLREIVDNFGTWEDLPADSFKSEGTSVNVALIVLDKPEEAEPVTLSNLAQASLF